MHNPLRFKAPPRRLVGLALGAVLLVIVATIFLLRARVGPSPKESQADHWDAVARGRAFLNQGRPDLAFEAVSSIRDEAPGAGEAMTIAGLVLAQYREYPGARLTLERALKLQPDQLDATKALASISLMLGNGIRGIELLEAAARLDPKDAVVWSKMGRVYHDLGDPANAARAFEESLKRSPNDRDTLFRLIVELLNGNRADDALPRLSEALSRFPDAPDFLGLAARQAKDAGKIEEAIDLASRTLSADPDNSSALLVRAQAEVALGHLEKALPDLERSVAAHPSDLGVLQLLAQVESRLGMTERARITGEKHRKAAERATLMGTLTHQIAEHPDDPEIRWKMGNAALEGGSTLLASQCFQAALALNPTYQPARDSLAALRGSQPENLPFPLRIDGKNRPIEQPATPGRVAR
jgi:tetratricopeptide (TPR) repeat protein